jgi:competence protein ComEA
MEQPDVFAPKRIRVRVRVGAAVVLFLVAVAAAVLFSAVAPAGHSADVGADLLEGPGVSRADGIGEDTTADPVLGATIFVHILGAVERPGLYELRDGARAVDAVASAGGFTATADQAVLNLARFVTDGEQIIVPLVGENPASNSGGAVGGAAGGAVVRGKININTADAATLETLPRIGPAMSARIIAWRDSNGRFTTIDDLMSVTGIGDKTFDGLKDLVTV